MEEATVVSALLFPGAAVGALSGGRLADALGRRGTLLICALLFLVGALGCAIAPNVGFMIVARVILGLGVGAAAVTCPLYLAEMAPAHLRGRMVTINELMIVTGQMLAFAINALLDALIHDASVWRLMLGVASIPAIALLIGMLVLPESPRWFALRDRFADSRRILDLSRRPAGSRFRIQGNRRIRQHGAERALPRLAGSEEQPVDAQAPLDWHRTRRRPAGHRHQHRELLRAQHP